MDLFVEFYDKSGDLVGRTPEVDYEYQAEQWVIDALEMIEVESMKAFLGLKPSNLETRHDQPLFAEWVVVQTPKGRDLKRLK
jgi:hypothetical protein